MGTGMRLAVCGVMSKRHLSGLRGVSLAFLGIAAIAFACMQGAHAQTHPGAAVYTANCVTCHGADGSTVFNIGEAAGVSVTVSQVGVTITAFKGIVTRGARVSLKINDAEFRSRASKNKAPVINAFLNGSTMGPQTRNMAAQDIANVINYVYKRLNNPVIDMVVTAAEVRGAKTFNSTCATSDCHGKTGEGDMIVPPLEGAVFLAKSKAAVIAKVLKGSSVTVSSGGREVVATMPAYESSLSKAQLSEVMTYIYDSINGFPAVSEGAFDLKFNSGSLAASINENEGEVKTAVGEPIKTVMLAVANTVAYSIVDGEDGALFGIDSSTGELSLTVATNFNHEVKDTYRIKLRATDTVDTSLTSDDMFVLTITNVDESPFFASDFPDQQVVVGATITFPEAIDPEGDRIVYSATRSNPDHNLPQGGVSFKRTSREFVVASSASAPATLTLKVTATQQGESSKTDDDTFVLEILVAKISVDIPGRNALSGTARTMTMPVKLMEAPTGGDVTLTLTSGDATKVAITPVTMEFSSSTWNTAQNLTVSITDSGIADKSLHLVNFMVAVYNRQSSATNYRVAAPVHFELVAVDRVPPLFTAASLMANINENISAANTAAGITVGTIAATDFEGATIAYSKLTGADAAVFGVDSDSGDVTLLVATNFNHEVKDTYTLNVIAFDGTDSSLPGEFVLTIEDVPEPPVIDQRSVMFAKLAVTGVSRNVTLAVASDPDVGAVIAYSVDSRPTWLTQTGNTDVFTINSNTSVAHTVTVVVTDTQNNEDRAPVLIDIVSKPSLSKWKLEGGKPVIGIAEEACVSSDRSFGAGLVSLEFTYNSGSKDGFDIGAGDCGSAQANNVVIGTGDGSVAVKSTFADVGGAEIEIGSAALAVGSHSYVLHYHVLEMLVRGESTVSVPVHTLIVNAVYRIAAATVTIAEVPGADDAAAGQVVGTIVLGSARDRIANANWSVVGTPAVAVGVAALPGSETTKGVLSLTSPAAVDFEGGAAFLTLTVDAATPDGEAYLVQARTELVIHLSDVGGVNDVNAVPEFKTSSLMANINENIGTANSRIGITVGTLVATDADPGDTVTYSKLTGADAAVFGVDSASGAVTLVNPTNFNHEGGKDKYTLNVRASAGTDNSLPGEFVLTIDDVPEPPALAALEDRTVIAGAEGTYQFAAAVDPDAGAQTPTYTVMLVRGGSAVALPADVGVSFAAGSRTFTFASTLAANTEMTLRVIARDGANSALESQPRDFVLRVRTGGSIVADTSSLAALSRTTRTSEIGVRLDLQPESAAVTVTIASLLANDVSAKPATMVFTRVNWNTDQNLTVSLTDAPGGVEDKSSRVVSVSLGVHGRAGSDGYFRGSVPHTVAVQVANANAAPMFDVAAIAAMNLMVNEHDGKKARAAADLGSPIAATDADNSSLVYSLVGGAGSEFEIVASDGQLKVLAAANINYERQSSYELVVQASDGEVAGAGLVPGIGRVTVTVAVANVAEVPDDYTSHGFNDVGRTRNVVTMSWNNAEYIAQFDAPDRASIVVSYGGGGYMGTLALGPAATNARLSGLVPGVAYAVTLHWYSADGEKQNTAVADTGVMSGANAAPVLSGLAPSRDENVGPELTAAGEVVATVSATDDDNDAITYSIRGGTDAAQFAIDAQSGEVSLVRAVNFDHESKASYTFMVAATDVYGAEDVEALVLGIEEIEEDPALPEQYTQNAVAGTATTFSIRAADDPDSGDNANIRYEAELANGDALPEWLTISNTTGEFSVGADAVAGTYQVRVQAVVVAPVSRIAGASAGLPVAFNEPIVSGRVFMLAVAASGSTNNLPDFAGATKVFSSLTENTSLAAGASVGTVAADDDDSGDTLTYSLRGFDAAPFSIGSGGALSIKDAVAFDHEAQSSYSFVVDVDDGNGGLASTEVEVQIADEPEAPEFVSAQEMFQVVGRKSSSFYASPAIDPDDGDSITYTASSPGAWLTNTALLFTVTADAPVGMHSVTLTASDGSLTDTHVFVVRVQTAGNRVPEFSAGVGVAAQFALQQQSGQTTDEGTSIGTVAATDADGHPLVYRIVPGADAVRFGVNGVSGQITVAADFAFVAGRTYRFAVEAGDGNGGVARIMVEFMVRVPAAPTDTGGGEVNQPPSPQQQQDKVAMAVMDRALAAAAVDLVQGRLGRPLGVGGSGRQQQPEEEPVHMRMASAVDQWGDWRYDHDSQADRIERMEWQDFLYSQGFDLALNGGSAARGRQGRLWGVGSKTSMDGNPVLEGGGRLAYDGSAKLFLAGAELGLPQARLGIAGGRSKADLKFGTAGDMRAERDLKVVHPYVSFRAEHVRLWVIGGYGKGDYTRIEMAGEDSEQRTIRDVRYFSAASGVESDWRHGTLELGIGAKALVMRSDGLQGLVQRLPLNSKAWRAQIDFEVATRPFVPMPGLALRPFAGMQLHHNGGGGLLDSNSVGTTAGMSLDWNDELKAEISAHWQIEDGDVNEERFDGIISYDYGSDGRGLMLSVEPNMAAGNEGQFRGSGSARVGYALPVRLLAESGIASLAADFSHGDADALLSSYGFRFAGRRLDIDLSAARDSYRLKLQVR